MDIIYQLQGVEFEWDETGKGSNIANHGVTFEEVAEVFFDPFYQGVTLPRRTRHASSLSAIPWPNGYCWSSMSTGGNGHDISRQAMRPERKLYEEA